MVVGGGGGRREKHEPRQGRKEKESARRPNKCIDIPVTESMYITQCEAYEIKHSIESLVGRDLALTRLPALDFVHHLPR